jgi:invasion protein IalB
VKEHSVRPTSAQIEQILADLRHVPPAPAGDHLSEDELIRYSMDMVSGDELERLDRHLASCAKCCDEVIDLMEAAARWAAADSKASAAAAVRAAPERLADAWMAMLRSRIVIFHVPEMAPAYAAAAKTHPRPHDGQTPDRHLRWRCLLERDGSLVVRLATDLPGAAGATVRVQAGNVAREGRFKSVATDEAFCEVIFSAEERRAMKPGDTLTVSVVEKPG